MEQKIMALRPFNTQHNEHAWWVHLDDGHGAPLCGERKPGYRLIPERITADNPHVCEPCQSVLATAATPQKD